MAGAARVLATWERARRQRRGGRKVGSPDVSAGRAGWPRSREAAGAGKSAGRRGAQAATPPATPGRLAGMDSAAAAFAVDKPALGPGPPPPSALGPGDCAQARKNFTVSHLLDLEEVAAAGRLAARPAGAETREGAAREPSGGSSGSEAAPQDGECGPGGRGPGAWERNAGSWALGARLGAQGAQGARTRQAKTRGARGPLDPSLRRKRRWWTRRVWQDLPGGAGAPRAQWVWLPRGHSGDCLSWWDGVK